MWRALLGNQPQSTALDDLDTRSTRSHYCVGDICFADAGESTSIRLDAGMERDDAGGAGDEALGEPP